MFGKKRSKAGIFKRRLIINSIALFFFCLSIKPAYAITPSASPSNIPSALSTRVPSPANISSAAMNNNLSAADQANSLQNQVSAQQALQNTAVSQAQSIQDSINNLRSAIDQDNAAIQQHQQTIADLSKEQQELTVRLNNETQTLGSYLRDQYINNDTTYLSYVSLLVRSTSLGDLINKWSYVDTILSYYQDLRSKLTADAQAIKVKQSLEQAETKKLQNDIQSKQQLADSLNAALAKQSVLVNSLSNNVLQSMLTQSRGEQDMDETQRLIAAEQIQAQLAAQAQYQQMLAAELESDSTLGTFSAPVKLNGQVGQLLSYAATFLGVPYTWGGTYPQFDCSSYVQYVFGHFGIKLKRVTWDQYTEGQNVAKNDLQAGDLVFFSTYQAGPSHVGIYVGNGIMINCDNSGVSFSNINSQYWSSRYYGARRVIAA